MKKLILFDIDGTLVSTGGAGTRSMNMAFHELFGIYDAFKNIPMAGKTDIQIMKEGLITHGLPHMDGNVEKMMNGYIKFLQREIDNPHRYVMPGIREALEWLNTMNMSTGLLTGNLQTGAKIKLGAFHLNEYFVDGAFGSDDEDRDRLLPIALDRFAERGFSFSPAECIVVGDTPRDVRCAKIHGAACIAVATGPYSKDALLATEADMVLETFTETEKYISFISGC